MNQMAPVGKQGKEQRDHEGRFLNSVIPEVLLGIWKLCKSLKGAGGEQQHDLHNCAAGGQGRGFCWESLWLSGDPGTLRPPLQPSPRLENVASNKKNHFLFQAKN